MAEWFIDAESRVDAEIAGASIHIGGDPSKVAYFVPIVYAERANDWLAVNAIATQVSTEEPRQDIGDSVIFPDNANSLTHRWYETAKGLEWELQFAEEPKSLNIPFELKHSGLQFWHQPALAQDEIDEGCVRPDNVVDSYAVYGPHGKFGHIYRPFIVDAKSVKRWCKWSVDEVGVPNGINIPEGIQYPAVLGPTFGYDTVGLSQGTTSAARIFVQNLGTPAVSGTVTSIDLYGNTASGTVNARGGLYADDDTLIASGTPNGITTTPQWHTLPISASVVGSTPYRLALWCAGAFIYQYDDDVPYLRRQTLTYSATNPFPDPTTAANLAQRYMSIRATYTEAAGESSSSSKSSVSSSKSSVSSHSSSKSSRSSSSRSSRSSSSSYSSRSSSESKSSSKSSRSSSPSSRSRSSSSRSSSSIRSSSSSRSKSSVSSSRSRSSRSSSSSLSSSSRSSSNSSRSSKSSSSSRSSSSSSRSSSSSSRSSSSSSSRSSSSSISSSSSSSSSSYSSSSSSSSSGSSRSRPKPSLGPADGQVEVDGNGQYYKYIQSQNAWINLGGVVNSKIVSYGQDGLLTPPIAELLEAMHTGALNVQADVVNSGSMSGLKIYGNSAYYFMLNPVSGLFEFSIEGGALRAEVDRTKLAYVLYMGKCSGIAGMRGASGPDGADGGSGPDELGALYSINGNTLSFKASVSTPLNTPISIRFVRNDEILAEALYYLDGASQFLPQPEFPYEMLSHSILYRDGILSASFVIGSMWDAGWTILVRQVGPPGRDGLDGQTFIEVIDLNIDDPIVVSGRAIATLRNRGSNFYYSMGFDVEQTPVAHLRQYGETRCDAVEATSESKFAAVEPAVSSSKVIWKWQFMNIDYSPVPPDLPTWVPDPSCLRPGVSFQWWGSVGADPGVVEAGLLPEKCCQEDFFFCPNIGSMCNVVPAETSSLAPTTLNTRYIPCT